MIKNLDTELSPTKLLPTELPPTGLPKMKLSEMELSPNSIKERPTNSLDQMPTALNIRRTIMSIAKNLKVKAAEIRQKVIELIARGESGHVGGSFSACDILTVLYYYKMTLDTENPRWAKRDRFILSKGHSVPLLYAILADLGILSLKPKDILRQLHSQLPGHPRMDITPGIDMSSGSLGMGISAGCGMAMAAKLDGAKYRTYVLVGDGELQEGQIWEGVMTASHFGLDNLTVIVDKNNLQSDSPVKTVKNCGEIADQFKAFNWNVIEINGHNLIEIINAFDMVDMMRGKPTVIVAKTCKGKGVTFMENNPVYHSSLINDHHQKDALEELKIQNECGN